MAKRIYIFLLIVYLLSKSKAQSPQSNKNITPGSILYTNSIPISGFLLLAVLLSDFTRVAMVSGLEYGLLAAAAQQITPLLYGLLDAKTPWSHPVRLCSSLQMAAESCFATSMTKSSLLLSLIKVLQLLQCLIQVTLCCTTQALGLFGLVLINQQTPFWQAKSYLKILLSVRVHL